MNCNPEGPGQAGEEVSCEPHEVQQGQAQGTAPGLGQTQVSIQDGDEQIEVSPAESDWGCW